MIRVRTLLLLSVFGVAAARADEGDWKPAEAKPAPVAPPVPAKPTPPAAEPTEPAEPTIPPGVDPNNWRPAKRYPVDYPPPPQPVEPVAAPKSEPIAVPADVFRPVAPPATLPPVDALPKVPVPDAPKTPTPDAPLPKPTPAETLPPPRPLPIAPPTAAPPAPVYTPPVYSSPASVPQPKLAADCPAPPEPTLHPDPNAGVMIPAGQQMTEVAPSRGKVFGSPGVSLSRDFAVRDLFGLDLITPGSSGEMGGGRGGMLFFQAEYLLWWVSKPNIPVLATTSASGNGNGFLGDPDTRNLLGPGTFGPGLHSGLRLRLGGYLDDCSPTGFDASLFVLSRECERQAFDSSRFPVITRPFFSPNATVVNTPTGPVALPGEFGEVVAKPGLSAGRLDVDMCSSLWGADVNIRRLTCRTCDGEKGWFAGYRNVNLMEQLQITENLRATGPLASDPVGTQVVVQDSFGTRNHFHGAQVGLFQERRYGAWDVSGRASLALGATHQILDIDGFQRRTLPGAATETFRGGLLAAGPNLGRFTTNRFSVVPEATLNLGYSPTPGVRLSFGYNFLYWSNVIRPGDQIDRTVDVTFVPNPPAGVPASGLLRPAPLFKQSDVWVQGVQFGVEVRW